MLERARLTEAASTLCPDNKGQLALKHNPFIVAIAAVRALKRLSYNRKSHTAGWYGNQIRAQPSLQVGPTLVVPLYESPRTLSPVTVCPLAFTCQKLIHSLHLYTLVPVSLYSRPDKNSKWRLVGLVRALLIPLEGSECDQDDSTRLFSFWDQPHSLFPLCLLVVILPACSLVAADESQLHFQCRSFVKAPCYWAITFINVSRCGLKKKNEIKKDNK